MRYRVSVVLGLVVLLAAVQSSVAQTAPMAVGTLRPTLDIATLDGSDHPTWDRLQGKVVVIDFWATWCAPCIASFPKMSALRAQFAGKPVVFYSITYEKPGAARGQLAKTPLSTVVALDNDFHTFEAFNAWGIPAVYIFDPSGKLVATTHPDHLDAAAIQAVLDGHTPALPPAQAWSDPKGAEVYFRSLRDKQAN